MSSMMSVSVASSRTPTAARSPTLGTMSTPSYSPMGTSRQQSPGASMTTMSPPGGVTRQQSYAGLRSDASTQQSDPRESRRRLHFPSPGDRRQRVATTFAIGCYSPPRYEGDLYPRAEVHGTQTENLYRKDAAVGEGADYSRPEERSIDLQLQLPRPEDFPVLTVGQLIEAEHRTKELIYRLEQAILVASKEEADRKQQERLLATEDDSGALQNTDEWVKTFGQKVDRRLRVAHGDLDGTKLPTQWTASKLELITSPSPFRQRLKERLEDEEVEAVLRRARGEDDEDGPPPPPPPPPEGPSTSPGTSRRRTAEDILSELRQANGQGAFLQAARKPHKENKWANFNIEERFGIKL